MEESSALGAALTRWPLRCAWQSSYKTNQFFRADGILDTEYIVVKGTSYDMKFRWVSDVGHLSDYGRWEIKLLYDNPTLSEVVLTIPMFCKFKVEDDILHLSAVKIVALSSKHEKSRFRVKVTGHRKASLMVVDDVAAADMLETLRNASSGAGEGDDSAGFVPVIQPHAVHERAPLVAEGISFPITCVSKPSVVAPKGSIANSGRKSSRSSSSGAFSIPDDDDDDEMMEIESRRKRPKPLALPKLSQADKLVDEIARLEGESKKLLNRLRDNQERLQVHQAGGSSNGSVVNSDEGIRAVEELLQHYALLQPGEQEQRVKRLVPLHDDPTALVEQQRFVIGVLDPRRPALPPLPLKPAPVVVAKQEAAEDTAVPQMASPGDIILLASGASALVVPMARDDSEMRAREASLNLPVSLWGDNEFLDVWWDPNEDLLLGSFPLSASSTNLSTSSVSHEIAQFAAGVVKNACPDDDVWAVAAVALETHELPRKRHKNSCACGDACHFKQRVISIKKERK